MIAYLFSLILPFLAAGLLSGTVCSCSRKHSHALRQAGTVCIYEGPQQNGLKIFVR